MGIFIYLFAFFFVPEMCLEQQIILLGKSKSTSVILNGINIGL